jgi:hypothetical protein
MRIRAADVRVGDVVEGHGQVLNVAPTKVGRMNISFDADRWLRFRNDCQLNVERPDAEYLAMEEMSLDGADKDFTNETYDEIRAIERETAAARAALITKLDEIIFDRDMPQVYRRIANDIVIRLADGNDPVHYLRSRAVDTTLVADHTFIMSMVELVKEAGL